MPDLDWTAIRRAVNSAEQVLALYVHCYGEAGGMNLVYAGFEPNWAGHQIQSWRAENFVMGREIPRAALLAKYPTLTAVLSGIEIGEFDQKAPPLQIVNRKAIQERQEIMSTNSKQLCQRTPGCLKPVKHLGVCPGRKLKVLSAPKVTATKDAELVYSPPPPTRAAKKTTALSARVAPPPPHSQFEIRHVQGLEVVHVCTENWSVARQAMALIEEMQTADR